MWKIKDKKFALDQHRECKFVSKPYCILLIGCFIYLWFHGTYKQMALIKIVPPSLIALWPWENYLTSLSPHFLIFRMGIIIVAIKSGHIMLLNFMFYILNTSGLLLLGFATNTNLFSEKAETIWGDTSQMHTQGLMGINECTLFSDLAQHIEHIIP